MKKFFYLSLILFGFLSAMEFERNELECKIPENEQVSRIFTQDDISELSDVIVAYAYESNGVVEQLHTLLKLTDYLIRSEKFDTSNNSILFWSIYYDCSLDEVCKYMTIKLIDAAKSRNCPFDIDIQCSWSCVDGEHFFSPTMYAIYKRNVELAKYLIDQGADLSLVDKDGNTALDWAKSKGLPELAKLIEIKIEKSIIE